MTPDPKTLSQQETGYKLRHHGQTAWIHSPTLPLTGCANLGQVLNVSGYIFFFIKWRFLIMPPSKIVMVIK